MQLEFDDDLPFFAMKDNGDGTCTAYRYHPVLGMRTHLLMASYNNMGLSPPTEKEMELFRSISVDIPDSPEG